METKQHNKYLPGWQLLGYPVPELDNNHEGEWSEDEEYNFYSLAGNDHNIREMEKEGNRVNIQVRQ